MEIKNESKEVDDLLKSLNKNNLVMVLDYARLIAHREQTSQTKQSSFERPGQSSS